MLEDDNAGLRKDIGLGHGDKIHVDDRDYGANSVLAKLFDQINSGTAAVSLSAERRHEVQRGVEAREAELQKILSVTNYLLRRKASKELRRGPSLQDIIAAANARSSRAEQQQATAAAAVASIPEPEAPTSPSTASTASEELSQEVSSLEEQARVLESQNQYLEIPYESIRILGGKENELGCGKCATVYRGVWMSRNGAAEVAVKSFRYVRLTDKILGDYTQEVAMLRKLKHPNIVLFIGACTNPKLLILTEYCSRKRCVLTCLSAACRRSTVSGRGARSSLSLTHSLARASVISLYEVIHGNNFETIPWKVRLVTRSRRSQERDCRLTHIVARRAVISSKCA